MVMEMEITVASVSGQSGQTGQRSSGQLTLLKQFLMEEDGIKVSFFSWQELVIQYSQKILTNTNMIRHQDIRTLSRIWLIVSYKTQTHTVEGGGGVFSK